MPAGAVLFDEVTTDECFVIEEGRWSSGSADRFSVAQVQRLLRRDELH